MNDGDFAGKVLEIRLKAVDQAGVTIEKVVIEDICGRKFLFGLTVDVDGPTPPGIRTMVAVDEIGDIMIYGSIDEARQMSKLWWKRTARNCVVCGGMPEHCIRCGNHVDEYKKGE